jgi:hypothetical protein
MATTAPNKDAAKVAKLREMAKDKTLPQDVRNQYLDQANMLEEKAAMGAGVKLAKGGAVKKPAAKKTAGKGPALVIAVGMGKPKGKEMMNKGGMAKKGKC